MNARMAEQPVTIIMVEDDEGHARLIEKNIRRAGVNNPIRPFTNGSDAVKFLFGADGTGTDNKNSALLILLDLNLPDMSGVDILKRLKENEHLKRSPVWFSPPRTMRWRSSVAMISDAMSTLPSP
jgi:CheY-like chemotaxis protein